MTEHAWYHAHLTEYASGLLDEREAALVREHLPGCPACRAELAEIEHDLRFLPMATAPLPPSPGFRDRTLRAALGNVPSRAARPPWWSLALAATTVLAVGAALQARSTTAKFEQRLRRATLGLAGTFAFSAVMNFVLARWIVTSPAGSEAFNAELGRLTLLSYPAIALPSMAMMLGLVWWLGHSVKALTGIGLSDLLHQQK